MIEHDGNGGGAGGNLPSTPPRNTKEATFQLFVLEVEKLRQKFDLASVMVIPTIVTPGARGPEVAATMALTMRRESPPADLAGAVNATLQVLAPTAKQLAQLLRGEQPTAPEDPAKKLILD